MFLVIAHNGTGFDDHGPAEANADSGNAGLLTVADGANAVFVAFRYDEASRLEAYWHLDAESAAAHGETFSVEEHAANLPAWMLP